MIDGVVMLAPTMSVELSVVEPVTVTDEAFTVMLLALMVREADVVIVMPLASILMVLPFDHNPLCWVPASLPRRHRQK